jgi:hypothetical protein
LEAKVIFLASRLLQLCGAADTAKNAENLAKAQLAN